VIETIAGTGQQAIADDGDALATPLDFPVHAIADGDSVVIADQSSGLVWRVR
jgi:hypothetical protein